MFLTFIFYVVLQLYSLPIFFINLQNSNILLADDGHWPETIFNIAWFVLTFLLFHSFQYIVNIYYVEFWFLNNIHMVILKASIYPLRYANVQQGTHVPSGYETYFLIYCKVDFMKINDYFLCMFIRIFSVRILLFISFICQVKLYSCTSLCA